MEKKVNVRGIVFLIVIAFVLRMGFILIANMSGNNSPSDENGSVGLYIGGLFFIFAGFGYAFAESFKKFIFRRVIAKTFDDLGLGGMENSYSIMGTGIGLAGVTWPLWIGLVAGCIVVGGVIRMAASHVISEAESQNHTLPIKKYMLVIVIALIVMCVITIECTLPLINVMTA